MKGIIKSVHIVNTQGNVKRARLQLKNRPVDIEEAREELKAKYKAKNVYFTYESN